LDDPTNKKGLFFT